MIVIVFFKNTNHTHAKSDSSTLDSILNNKKQIKVYYNENYPFIYKTEKGFAGIEYEIIHAFTKYVNKKYSTNLKKKWIPKDILSNFEETVKEVDKNCILASSISITEDRKKHVRFSPAYMPDIEVIVTSDNSVDYKNISEFIRALSSGTAVLIRGSTFEENILRLEKEHKVTFQKTYVTNLNQVIEKVALNPGFWAYTQLSNYFFAAASGKRVKRQRFYQVSHVGLALAMPHSSFWSSYIEDFFKTEEFRQVLAKSTKRYFKEFSSGLMEHDKAISTSFFDSLNSTEAENKLLMIESKLKELQIKEKEAKLKEERLLRNLFFFGFGTLIIFLFILLNLNNIKKRSAKELHKKNKEIEKKSNELEISFQNVKKLNEKIEKKKTQLEETNLELIELNNEKNYLLSVLAHDLRNPLTSSLSVLNGIKSSEVTYGEDMELGLGLVSRSLDNIKVIIERMLEKKSTIDSSGLLWEGIDLKVFIEESLDKYNLIASRKRIKIKHELESLTVKIDKFYLNQILDNLISNAIKFSPFDKNIIINLIENEGNARLEIIDQGPGFTEEDKQKIFGKFQRLSAKPTDGEPSTGLGLSIVKNYAELLKGKVWCESTVGKGAKFIVEFGVIDVSV